MRKFGVLSTLALASGTGIMLWRPNRPVTLLAGCALLLLGIQQLGWARAIVGVPFPDRGYWLDLSLICWLPVSLAWLFLSITLGRGTDARAMKHQQRLRQVGPGKEGAKGSYTIYRIAKAA